ncbi:MAG: TlpA disulfide reductase family protein, partial [Mariprofundaceae bacterium]
MHVKFTRVAVMLLMAAVSAPAASAGTLADALADFGVQQPKVRKAAPVFSLKGMDGVDVSLADFRGQTVLLHFWATWCVPCRHEMPLLHDLERQLSGGLLRVVCVNVDRNDKHAVRAFMDAVTPHFHTLLDPQGSVRNRYEVRALPTSYLIAPDGR